MTDEELLRAAMLGSDEYQGGKTRLVYRGEKFVLVKISPGWVWSSVGSQANHPPWVERYDLREDGTMETRPHAGKTVWDSHPDIDGPLRAPQLRALVAREESKG